jgi:hypothetical protein
MPSLRDSRHRRGGKGRAFARFKHAHPAALTSITDSFADRSPLLPQAALLEVLVQVVDGGEQHGIEAGLSRTFDVVRPVIHEKNL